MRIRDLATPAVIVDSAVLDANLAAMAAVRPGRSLRPHVKAHKCTALADRQRAHGHDTFTCATPREAIGMAAAGLGADLLLANETVDVQRLRAMARNEDAIITVAVDSDETVDAAAAAGIQQVLIDVNIGLPRCGCRPDAARRLADRARARGLGVRGVMGYEGHLMVVADAAAQRIRVAEAVDTLLRAHADVGGEIVSSGGTGTYHLHPADITEVQAGSYALMDSHYAAALTNSHGTAPFRQACWVLGTVISVSSEWAVVDVGLKALGMDHGNPVIDGGTVWFCSDEHTTFAMPTRPMVGDRIRVIPAHVDPTLAQHDAIWVIDGDEVIDRWPIDLRGW
jgi:D-threonine aldolase